MRLKLFISILLLYNFQLLAKTERFDSLWISLSNLSGIQKVDTLNFLTQQELSKNSIYSQKYALESIRLADSLKYSLGKINALNNIAFYFYINNKIDSTIILCKQAQEIALEKREFGCAAKSRNLLGLVEWRKGAYDKAIDHYLKAIEYAKIASDDIETANAFNYLGLVYWKTGYYPKSIEYFYNSLEIKKAKNNKYEIALTLNNLSNVHNDYGDFTQAIIFAKDALEISELINNDYTRGRALGNLGISHLKMGNYSNAIKYLNEAIKVKEQSGETKGLGYSLLDLGDLHYKLENVDSANLYYQQALVIMEKIQDSHGQSIALSNLAKIQFKKSKYNLSLSLIQRSNKFARRENLRENIKENYFLLSQIMEKINRPQKALNYFKKYSTLHDSLLNAKTNSEILRLRINYETVEKEKENQLLKQNNIIQSLEIEQKERYIFLLVISILFVLIILAGIFTLFYNTRKTKKLLESKNSEINIQRMELKNLNATKDKFFSIIAHDLKNPFQTMLGFSSMLVKDYENLENEEKLNVLKRLENISKSLFALVQNLLNWSLAQTERLEYNPQKYSLRNLIIETISLITFTAKEKNITIDKNVSVDHDVYVDENYVTTILRNLLTNAVKFTSQNGNVIIESFDDGNHILVKVKDNGIGMDEKIVDELFELKTLKSSNNDHAQGSGLGLVLCKELVSMYGGKIWAESKPGVGSTFFFTIPKP